MNWDSGLPFQMTKSPSFPGSSEPTRSSMAIAFAAWSVTVDRACSSVSPVRSSLPASQFMRLANPLSFTELTPEWMCGSMSPGVTCLPAASISTAPRGASRSRPTATTFPASTRRSAFPTRPCAPCVHTVALRTTTAADCSGGEDRP